MKLGEKIREARKRCGLSQEQLAEKMSVSRSAVAKWEANIGIPDVDNLKALAKLLNVSVDSLLDDGGIIDEVIMSEPHIPSDCGEVNKKTQHKKTTFQKVIKCLVISGAILLSIGIIGGILRMFGVFSAVTKDVQTYTVSSDIKGLEIKVNAADFVIKQGEKFSVESNLKGLTVEEKNGILTIKETNKFIATYNGAVLTLYIPTDMLFEKANITTGAGKLTVDCLSAATMKLKLGAGEVKIDTLIATSDINIAGGAGKITISDGALHNLDLEMGVGQLNLTSLLSGNCDFKSGVGEANITVTSDKSNYNLDLKNGIGKITVDGTSVSNFQSQNNGSNSIKISGGIGAINLTFKEP